MVIQGLWRGLATKGERRMRLIGPQVRGKGGKIGEIYLWLDGWMIGGNVGVVPDSGERARWCGVQRAQPFSNCPSDEGPRFFGALSA